MVFGIAFAVAVLVSGIALLTISSDKAIDHSVHFAQSLGISSLMIGLILVSIGTDLPEMANSIVACASGHGNIDVGDSIGSILTQITLILGLIPFLSRSFNVKRKEVLVIGGVEILAVTLAVFTALTGFTGEALQTRISAFLLMITWPLFLYVIKRLTAKDIVRKEQYKPQNSKHYLVHLLIASLSFVGVAIGALAVVESVILLNSMLGIPEFLISFFVVAIGTSLPELVVDLTAIRKRQYELAIGDIIGSCIVDATVSISIGQFFFPTRVFYEAPERSVIFALYAILASVAVIMTLALRKKVDKKAGVLFILIYSLAYVFLYIN